VYDENTIITLLVQRRFCC